jgi:hypothetical protein
MATFRLIVPHLDGAPAATGCSENVRSDAHSHDSIFFTGKRVYRQQPEREKGTLARK